MRVHPLTTYIRKELAKRANPENAKSMQAYMKSEMPYRGVKTAGQREIYKITFKKYPVDAVSYTHLRAHET